MTTIVQAAYIVSALLFIMALAGLSKHETAKTGNAYGVTGMAIAIVATIYLALKGANAEGALGVPAAVGLIVVAMLIGAVIGLWRAKSVEMTQMPELIAILHSLVGAAAVLVGYNSFL
ncbi:MAG: NAD(P)(+) transhydrogenase (Re/Si-specific) subunit beta, partial [Actinobacteria bacterium]|nr:NAD(P)(+) transhydrogenase (Re/Si-specific) subunit beta [Actinomycetota bacterium]